MTLEIPRISLEACRKNAKLNQKEMADAMGVNINTIINWEKGRSEPTLSQARLFSNITGVPLDFIFIPCKS